MSTKFVGVSSSAVVGNSIELAVPNKASLKAGDLLFTFVAVQAFIGTSLTMPDATWIAEPSPASIGDLIVFTAFHYVGVDEEPDSYVFSYSSSKPISAALVAYRGAQQDVLFDSTNYPLGFYAPSGSQPGVAPASGVASIASPATVASSLVPFGRSVFFFAGTHASQVPLLSDVSPLIPIRTKVQQAKLSISLCDALEPVELANLPTYSIRSNVTLANALGLSRTFEPLVAANDSFDTFKAKIMRRLIPPPYRGQWNEILPGIITAIGGGDNDIGGLFGDEDFLPDEV